MMMSILSPFIGLNTLISYSNGTKPDPTKLASTAQQMTAAPRDILPFATGLVGFAGGVVTAMYRTSTAASYTDTGGTNTGGTNTGSNDDGDTYRSDNNTSRKRGSPIS